MIVSVPGGWPVCLWPARWPDDRNIWKWGCRVRCPSWHSVVCRFPPVTEMKGCPRPAASEATLPPLGALERWEGKRERQETGYRWERDEEGDRRGKKLDGGKKRRESGSREGGRERENNRVSDKQTVNIWLHLRVNKSLFYHSVNHRSKPTTKIVGKQLH